jgi:hypothetical protein
MVFMCDYASREGIDLNAVLHLTWEKVKQRRQATWVADKEKETPPTETMAEVLATKIAASTPIPADPVASFTGHPSHSWRRISTKDPPSCMRCGVLIGTPKGSRPCAMKQAHEQPTGVSSGAARQVESSLNAPEEKVNVLGSNVSRVEPKPCEECGGTGEIQTAGPPSPSWRICHPCNGTGFATRLPTTPNVTDACEPIPGEVSSSSQKEEPPAGEEASPKE